jgi:hypothetical protein
MTDASPRQLASLVESLTCEDATAVVEFESGRFHSAILVQEDEFGAEVVIRAFAEVAPGAQLVLRINERRDPCVARAVLHVGNSTWIDVQWNWSEM